MVKGKLNINKPISEGRGKEKSTFHGPPPLRKGSDYVNVGEEDQMEIIGFAKNNFKTVVTWIAIVCSAFILRLIFHWKPEWMLFCTHVRCSLAKAQKILLLNHYKQTFVEEVKIIRSNEAITESKNARDIILQQMAEKGSKLMLPNVNGTFTEVQAIRFFENKSCTYIWDVSGSEFYKLHGLQRVLCSYFYQQKGLPSIEQERRKAIYGSNSIEVPVQSILKLLFLEVLNPFYVFQVFSVCLWYAEEYMYYATCIIVMSVISIGATIVQTRANQKALRNTVQSSDVVTVWRGRDVYETIPSEHLVPGDVIVIPSHGCMMYCDAVLISGNCIVNESMLTGESVPITKTPIPNILHQNQNDEMYHSKEHAKHTLFCGTKVIQTRYYGREKVKAVVIRTGFMTTKGELVRSIMYPKPLDFKFQQDSYKFIGVLFGISIIGFIYTLIVKTLNGTPPGDKALDTLDLITIVVPPALPAAMTVGIAYAQARLRRNNIYCISPRAINISGCVNCVCFDKTGTLTEDGLDMWGVVPSDKKQFKEAVRDIEMLPRGPLVIGMATCHSLTIIDGQLSGDPLDLKMFESTTWILEEPEIDETTKFDIISPTVVKPKGQERNTEGLDSDNSLLIENHPFEIGIVRQFTFSSSLQRMSVITRVLGAKHFEIYTKGSPEMIASLCNPDTVPQDFTEILMTYTQHGYRVLALATKPLPKMTYAKVQRISREQVECNLTFLGLLVMENRLKPETTPIIRVLKKADIRTVMVTGDNMLTALSVARDCEMIEKNHRVIMVNSFRKPEDKSPMIQFVYAEMADKEVEEVEYISKQNNTTVVIEEQGEKFHFAVTGKVYAIIRENFPELMPKLVVRGTVFARMSPDQKKQLIEHLQELGFYVGMCGDGANDCEALKAAHAGVSLSEAEASVASPFTSKHPNISCVPTIVKEGRSALVTSFGIFKYMAAYSLTQFVSVMILYSIESNLTDMEFLYIDLFIITLLAAVFGRTAPYPALVKKQPPSSLISLSPIASILLQMFIMIGFQTFAFFFVKEQPWYSPHIPHDTSDLKCYENYSVFAVSAFQYITLAVVFSKGAPYRKSFFSNYFFLASLIGLTAFTVYIVIYPTEWLIDNLELQIPPYIEYRLLMVGIAGINFILCILCELFIVGHLLFRICENKLGFFQPVYQYMHIEKEIRSTPEWPPVSKEASIEIPILSDHPAVHVTLSDEEDNEGKETGAGEGYPQDTDLPGSRNVLPNGCIDVTTQAKSSSWDSSSASKVKINPSESVETVEVFENPSVRNLASVDHVSDSRPLSPIIIPVTIITPQRSPSSISRNSIDVNGSSALSNINSRESRRTPSPLTVGNTTGHSLYLATPLNAKALNSQLSISSAHTIGAFPLGSPVVAGDTPRSITDTWDARIASASGRLASQSTEHCENKLNNLNPNFHHYSSSLDTRVKFPSPACLSSSWDSQHSGKYKTLPHYFSSVQNMGNHSAKNSSPTWPMRLKGNEPIRDFVILENSKSDQFNSQQHLPLSKDGNCNLQNFMQSDTDSKENNTVHSPQPIHHTSYKPSVSPAVPELLENLPYVSSHPNGVSSLGSPSDIPLLPLSPVEDLDVDTPSPEVPANDLNNFDIENDEKMLISRM